MLEMRHIGGRTEHFAQLLAQLPSTFHPQDFFLAKHSELRQRHTKFENAPYALEPNCKESPGGLRDLHTILWVAKVGQSGARLA